MDFLPPLRDAPERKAEQAERGGQSREEREASREKQQGARVRGSRRAGVRGSFHAPTVENIGGPGVSIRSLVQPWIFEDDLLMVDELGRARALASPSRNELLHLLQQRGPTTIADLAEGTGLHPNTVREHLARLLEVDLVRREAEVRTVRGRPRMFYRATSGAEAVATPEGSARFEAGVARMAFARAIIEGFAAPEPDTRARAEAAGAAIGRSLRRDVPAAGSKAATEVPQDPAERGVLALEAHLDAFGFDPQWEGEAQTFHLWRCPFWEMAQERPDVVCGVHSGLAEGVLESAGGAMTVERLTPFVGPHHCTLAIRPR